MKSLITICLIFISGLIQAQTFDFACSGEPDNVSTESKFILEVDFGVDYQSPSNTFIQIIPLSAANEILGVSGSTYEFEVKIVDGWEATGVSITSESSEVSKTYNLVLTANEGAKEFDAVLTLGEGWVYEDYTIYLGDEEVWSNYNAIKKTAVDPAQVSEVIYTLSTDVDGVILGTASQTLFSDKVGEENAVTLTYQIPVGYRVKKALSLADATQGSIPNNGTGFGWEFAPTLIDATSFDIKVWISDEGNEFDFTKSEVSQNIYVDGLIELIPVLSNKITINWTLPEGYTVSSTIVDIVSTDEDGQYKGAFTLPSGLETDGIELSPSDITYEGDNSVNLKIYVENSGYNTVQYTINLTENYDYSSALIINADISDFVW